MTDIGSHQNQYTHNLSLLSEDLFSKETYSDWMMTVIFYTAVHLIEKDFASLHRHSRSHDERVIAIKGDPKLKFALPAFAYLLNESRRARYDCKRFSKSDVKYAMARLRDIEGYVNRQTT